jgi:hypothetical protein
MSFDFNQVRDKMIAIQDGGCAYLSCDVTLAYGAWKFNAYTPETSHKEFTDFPSFLGHLDSIAAKGEVGKAKEMAAKKMDELLKKKADLTREIAEVHRHQEHLAAMDAASEVVS